MKPTDKRTGGRTLTETLDVPSHLGETATDRDVAYEYEPLADGLGPNNCEA